MHRDCPACVMRLTCEYTDRVLATYPEHVCPRCQSVRLDEFAWEQEPEPDVVVIVRDKP